jgi:hypothetical protein
MKIVNWLEAAAAAVVVLTAGWAFTRRIAKKAANFFDDWNGEPSRPGVRGRDGVMTRLEHLDTGQLHVIEQNNHLDVRLTAVEAQVQQNHGISMHDKIDRIETAIANQEQ